MILENVQVRNRKNFYTKNLEMDCPELCIDIDHYNNFKKEIVYSFNSRGFRDTEWPETNLDECIWCFGDSALVGLGNPHDETWSAVLGKHRKTINISMLGSSPNWTARMAADVLREIKPRCIVIQWTFIPRREEVDELSIDGYRQLPFIESRDDIGPAADIRNLANCINTVNQANTHGACIIHSWNPEYCRIEYPAHSPYTNIVVKSLKHYHNIELEHAVLDNRQLDVSRDGYHYGVKTAENYANNYLEIINQCLK